jgi:hypothetical protein
MPRKLTNNASASAVHSPQQSIARKVPPHAALYVAVR